MGIFDGGSIADLLIRLVNSPGVRDVGSRLIGTANTQSSGPFGASSNQSSGGISGAKSRSGGTFSPHRKPFSDTSQQPTPAADPLMSLYSQLLNRLQQPVDMPTGVDTADLMAQVRSAIDPIYNQRASSAEARTGRATKQVKDMYRSLSDDYERLAPQQVAQADAAKEEIGQLYGKLRSNIEGSYSRVSDEQGELFKSLGIEAALPDVLEEQAAPVQEASLAASENQAQQEQRYMDIGQTDSTYYREGSPLATMTGNEVSTGMLNKLQDYLGQIEAERTSGIQTAYMDQLNQANSLLAQKQQAAQGESGRRQEMLWQMLQGQLGGKQQELNPDSFMAQLPPQIQQSVAGAFTRLQRSPEAVYGKVEDKRNPVPGSFVETQPQWFLAQADKMLQNGEIDETTYQALQMYMQLYYKMGS